MIMLPVVFLPLVAICALHNVQRVRPARIWGGIVLAEVHIGAVKQKQRACLDLSAHNSIGCLYHVCGMTDLRGLLRARSNSAETNQLFGQSAYLDRLKGVKVPLPLIPLSVTNIVHATLLWAVHQSAKDAILHAIKY